MGRLCIRSMQQHDRQFRYDGRLPEFKARNPLHLPSIVESGISEGHGRSSALSTNSDANMLPAGPVHNFGSVSPVEPGALPTDYYRNTQSSGMGTHLEHLSSAMIHNPKRAYRQRRKDPSCDACRERKVKVGRSPFS